MLGSLDDIEDIREKLNKLQVAYVLMLGREDENAVRIWSNAWEYEGENEGDDGEDVMDVAWQAYMKAKEANRE